MEIAAIMALLPELPVVGPAVAPRAHAQTETIVINTGLKLNPYGPLDVNPPDPDPIVVGTPCFRIAGQIIQQMCSYVNPPGSLDPFINATPPFGALKLFESDSVGTYLKTNYMSPDDAPLVYQYAGTEMRGQIRTLMLNRILKMVGGAPNNALERSVYDWFKYQMWLFERTTYEIAVAERNAWQSNPCGWRPDPDLTDAYGLKYNPQKFCNNNNTLQGLLGDPPIVPSKAYFLGAAQKKVYGKAVEQGDTNGAAAMARMWLTDGVGAGISVLAGGGLGAGIGAGARGIWSATLRGVGTTVRNIRPSSFLKIGATGPAIIVTLMIQAGIEMGFRVFEYENAMKELKTLDDDLAAIRKGPSELSRYQGDPGRFKMTQVFTSVTLPEFSNSGPFPAHDPLTDPVFYLTPSNTYSDTVTYQDDSGTTFAAKTYKGWFLRQCLTKCDNVAATAVIPTLDIVDSAGDAWTAARLGGMFGVVKQAPKADEDLCELLSTAKDPSKCAGYITPSVSYLDAAGNAGTFSLVSQPVFTSPSTVYFTHGVAGTFTVTATGAPSPTIGPGAPPPAGFTITPGTGSATIRYDGSTSVTPGTYNLKVAAVNQSSAAQTVTVAINGIAPVFASPNVATFTKGVPGAFTVRATGNPTPALTVGTPHFPPLGLDFVDNGDGTATISGTVPINSPGCGGSECTGLINATVPGLQTQQSLTIDVKSPVLPFLLPSSLVFTAGIEAEGKIVATGSTLGKLANVCQTLPSWLTFRDNGNNTATVSGTPPAGSPAVGLHVIVAPPGVPVEYHCGPVDSPNYTVGVTTKPVFTSSSRTTFTAGILGSFKVDGVTTDPISMSGSLPAGVYFFPLPASTYGLLTGTPAEGSGGVYPLVFTRGTGANAVTQDFTLVVNERPGFVAPYGATFTINQPSSLPITVIGYPQTPVAGQQGMTMQTSIPSLPPGMVLVEALSPLGGHTGSWMLTGTPTTATGRYTATISASNGVGLVREQPFTLDVVPPALPKLPPILTWAPPAAITYGSALSATQLNATTTIPGTFIYTPPAGTVLPVGSQSLSVTFVPADSDHYATGTTSTYITVNPAPTGTVGKPNLVVTKTLSRMNMQGVDVIAVQVRVANTGNAPAENVTLTSVKVGSNAGTPTPQNLGTLLPGTSLQAYFQAIAPAAAGTASSLSISGTYTGGTISSNARIALP